MPLPFGFRWLFAPVAVPTDFTSLEFIEAVAKRSLHQQTTRFNQPWVKGKNGISPGYSVAPPGLYLVP